jgi:hypothetical protein
MGIGVSSATSCTLSQKFVWIISFTWTTGELFLEVEGQPDILLL